MKIIVTDNISEDGLNILRQDTDVDVFTNLSLDELLQKIAAYDALIVRSGTKVTEEVINAGTNLKVIGRAGVGVDNIDVDKATEKGIMVINAPEGNTISAAEHTMALMMSLARNIPRACASLRSREWKRNKFMGVELFKKKLGIIGLGRIGSEVAKRARSFGMDILAYDPFISPGRVEKLGVNIASLEEIYRNADFITLHTPMNSKTYHIIGRKELDMMKEGVRIINVARGGLIDEKALYEAVKEGKVAGAALDVFEEEPPLDSPLLELENIIVTPHLGASTQEAQVNVAVQVAEQVLKALKGEPVVSAVNVPVVPPEVLAEVEPFLPLMNVLGRFYMQVYNGQIEEVELLYSGEIAHYPVAPLTTAALIGILSGILHYPINYVNALTIAKQRGIKVKELTNKSAGHYTNLITLNVTTSSGQYSVAGTLYHGNSIRIVQIGEHYLEFEPTPYMLVTSHIDQPGVIGAVGTFLGNRGINIAGMYVGREKVCGKAVMVLQVDNYIPEEVVKELAGVKPLQMVKFVQL